MRYKRLNYGTKSAQDILQIEMLNTLAGIENQVNISDDIMVEGTTVEHDAAFAKVLERLRENGITVNLKKCVFDVPEIEFVGLVFNNDGIKPNPRLYIYHIVAYVDIRLFRRSFMCTSHPRRSC